MEYTHYMSEDNSSKDDFSDHEDQIIKYIPKEHVSEKKDIQVNTFINDFEEFEKGFNTAFNPDKAIYQSNDEEEKPPIFSDVTNDYKSIKGYPEKQVIIDLEEKDEEDKCFPFTKGIGMEKTLGQFGLQIEYNSPTDIKLSSDGSNQLYTVHKFKTTEYYIDEKGKKKKKKPKRKDKSDDIRKKIKAIFHKVLKEIINKRLKKAGAKQSFNYFPQCFITNVTIEINSEALNFTYEEVIEHRLISSKNAKIKDMRNFNSNLEVLKYLRENEEISKKSEFEKIKNMKYCDLLKAFVISKEFEETLTKLCDSKEKMSYIQKYINRALTYADLYANKKYGRNSLIESSYDNGDEEEEEEVEEEKDCNYECE